MAQKEALHATEGKVFNPLAGLTHFVEPAKATHGPTPSAVPSPTGARRNAPVLLISDL